MCIYNQIYVYIIKIIYNIIKSNQIWLHVSSILSPSSSSPSSSLSSSPSISSTLSTSYKENWVTTLPHLSTILPCSVESLSIWKDSLSNPYSLSSLDLLQSLSKSPSKMLCTTRSTFISSLSLLQSLTSLYQINAHICGNPLHQTIYPYHHHRACYVCSKFCDQFFGVCVLVLIYFKIICGFKG